MIGLLVPWWRIIAPTGALTMSQIVSNPKDAIAALIAIAIGAALFGGLTMLGSSCIQSLGPIAAPKKQEATRPQKTREQLRDQYGPAMQHVDGRAIWRSLLGSGWSCRGQTAEGWAVFAERQRGGQAENISWYGVDDSEICSLSAGSLGGDDATARQTLTYIANLVAGEAAADWVATNWAYGGEITQPGVHLRLHRTSTASTLTISAAP